MREHKTREGWLVAAMVRLDKKFFKGNGYELPAKLQASCGFPKSSSNKVIGQCHPPSNSADETTHIFVCPTQADVGKVLATLLHEMIHASVGCAEGHRGAFKKLARQFGLAGRLTATHAGDELERELLVMAGHLGAYPHAAMIRKSSGSKRKGNGRYVRLTSVKDPTFNLVMQTKVFAAFGAAWDPWGEEMVPSVIGG